MIARDMRLYDVYTIGAPDAFGQKAAPAYSRTIKAALYERAQAVKDGIVFIEGDFIALTRSELTGADMIATGGEWYKVLYVQKRGTYNQAFLKYSGAQNGN